MHLIRTNQILFFIGLLHHSDERNVVERCIGTYLSQNLLGGGSAYKRLARCIGARASSRPLQSHVGTRYIVESNSGFGMSSKLCQKSLPEWRKQTQFHLQQKELAKQPSISQMSGTFWRGAWAPICHKTFSGEEVSIRGWPDASQFLQQQKEQSKQPGPCMRIMVGLCNSDVI